MWIFMNDAFISVVAPSAADLEIGGERPDADLLSVRARRRGDLTAVFGNDFPIIRIVNRDYPYRTFCTRQRIAQIVADRICEIDYGNFKDSVPDKSRAGVYMSVWAAGVRLEPGVDILGRHEYPPVPVPAKKPANKKPVQIMGPLRRPKPTPPTIIGKKRP